MGGKKDYLKGVEWKEKKFIANNGAIGGSTVAHYNTNVIYLPSGTYLLNGVQTYGSTIYYRIHQYDSNDNWIKQIQFKGFTSGEVVYQINITEPSYIRLSIAMSFTGTLTKV